MFRAGRKHGVAFGDGKLAKAEHDWIQLLTYRPDGKELACAAGTGGTASAALMTEDGTPQIDGAQWKLVRYETNGVARAGTESFRGIAHIAWSSDGARVAFAARTAEGWRIVCGEQRSDPFDEVGPPRFTADGAKVAFGARKGRELWWKVLALAK